HFPGRYLDQHHAVPSGLRPRRGCSCTTSGRMCLMTLGLALTCWSRVARMRRSARNPSSRTELPIRRAKNERLHVPNRFHDEERFNCERGPERPVAAVLAAIGTGATKLPKQKGRTAIAVACLSRQL